MIENIDDNIGLLVKKLDQWQAWENTLVIFMTDNGQASRTGKINGKQVQLHTAGFKTGKGSPYEGGTHVPAFWRWKGVLGEGIDLPQLTAHIDLYKTFCDLADVEIGDSVQPIDGRSLLPLLEDPKAPWTDRELFVHQGRWAKGEDPNQSKLKNCAVRTKRWRFVNDSELFDISRDPFESTNVFDKHPEVVARLRAAFDTWWANTVPLMVNENTPYTATQPQADRYDAQLSKQGIPDWIPPAI